MHSFAFSLLARPVAELPANITQWVVLGVAVLGTSIVFINSKKRTKKDPLERKPASNSLAQQRSVERQMQNLLVDLSEMARQITAGLDTRATKLDLLIREADEKIARLTALQSFQPPPRANGSTAIDPPPPVQPPPSAYEPDPRHVQVYSMADQGHTPMDIAAQLDRPRGEIELILALRPR